MTRVPKPAHASMPAWQQRHTARLARTVWHPCMRGNKLHSDLERRGLDDHKNACGISAPQRLASTAIAFRPGSAFWQLFFSAPNSQLVRRGRSLQQSPSAHFWAECCMPNAACCHHVVLRNAQALTPPFSAVASRTPRACAGTQLWSFRQTWPRSSQRWLHNRRQQAGVSAIAGRRQHLPLATAGRVVRAAALVSFLPRVTHICLSSPGLLGSVCVPLWPAFIPTL